MTENPMLINANENASNDPPRIPAALFLAKKDPFKNVSTETMIISTNILKKLCVDEDIFAVLYSSLFFLRKCSYSFSMSKSFFRLVFISFNPV